MFLSFINLARIWRDSQADIIFDRRADFWWVVLYVNLIQESYTWGYVLLLYLQFRNRRSFDEDNKQIGFSAVGASWDAQIGRQGRIKFENTLANFNRGWNTRDSVFQCDVPGLYFFTMTALGRTSYDRYYPQTRYDSSNRNDCIEWK